MKINIINLLSVTALVLIHIKASAQVSISYDTRNAPVQYAINQLGERLSLFGEDLILLHSQSPKDRPDIAVILQHEKTDFTGNELSFQSIHNEGYMYKWANGNNTLLVLANDAVGAMYGLLDLAEHIDQTGTYTNVKEKAFQPSLEYRIIKFNLPWSPYRDSEATNIHTHTCRDLKFWEEFLDMMVENRWNVLSLWNNHPFPYMIRAANFPKATPFDDREMAVWQQFWQHLFKMAKDRGIQTFIVNWNIVVSPEFVEAYGGTEYNDLSEQVKKYTRESVTQMINEYPDLTGIGVTLADWMGTFDERMTPTEREDWIEDTFVEGMKAADRKVKFLHRSVLAGDPMAMRDLLDKTELQEPALVEIKFNWSHGHSTPKLAITHDYHSGELDERFWKPFPETYRIQWMVRNEDFFILRWGETDFIRDHISENLHGYVNGYFIGSEGYIPAMDYSHLPSPQMTWQYGFQKQWMFYKTWGRLLYDKNTSDDYFEIALEEKYGFGLGRGMLQAYKLASRMPLRMASFYRSTWDYTLYSEGFIAAEPSSRANYFDRSSPFISILEWMDHETLDPDWVSIRDYVSIQREDRLLEAAKISPLQIADLSEKDSKEALEIIERLLPYTTEYTGALESELMDLATWSYMGLYMSDKIRAGVALENYSQSGESHYKEIAVSLLEKCLQHWDQVIHYTKHRYRAVPHVSTEHYGEEFTSFSWEQLRPQVVRDIHLAKTFEK